MKHLNNNIRQMYYIREGGGQGQLVFKVEKAVYFEGVDCGTASFDKDWKGDEKFQTSNEE